MFTFKKILFPTAAALLLATACTVTDEASEDDGGGNEANGVTPCGNFPDEEAKSCQAGQYCADEIFSECEIGCLSDTNCANAQTCIKDPGADVGSCQNNASAVCGNGSCEAGEDAASCAQDCSGGPSCGNGICETGEDAAGCAQDCATGPICGNGICETGEDSNTCAPDCGGSLVVACKDACDEYLFFDCFVTGQLQECYDDCDQSDDVQITEFLNCVEGPFCNQDDCLPSIAG